MNTFSKLKYIFDRKQKINILFLSVLIIIGALFELFGITAILPFVDVAIDSEQVYKNEYLYYFYELLEMDSPNTFLAVLAFLLIFIYLMKNLYLVFMNSRIFHFSYDNQRKLSYRLLACYLKEPYTFFLNNNSADLLRNVKDDTNMLFDTVLAAMELAVECIVCVLLLSYLMITDKSITIAVGIVLIGFMLIIMKGIKKHVQIRGENVRKARGGISKWLLQTFGGIKETKIMEREYYFLKKVDEQNAYFAENQCRYQILAYIPKPAMETVCIGSVLFVIALKLLSGVSSEYFVSTISVFAVAAFRLLPAFNRITGYISRIMFNRSSVDAIYNDLKEVEIMEQAQKDRKQEQSEVLKFNQEILIKDVTFRYPNTEQDVLKDIVLSIPKNKSVAFVGPSGAGKTTLADIVLGILSPTEGDVLVDGISVLDRMSAWHEKLGYIPQSIYLLDDTIKRNIAFAISDEEIDEERMMRAIEEAQLTEFIDSLELGVDTEIGEQGIRLSGGQRQRIGIARALYSDPEVLILDEATSALDNETEKAVMDAIDSLSGKKTLIIIAHRLSTIRNCDLIFEVRDTKVTIKNKGKIG